MAPRRSTRIAAKGSAVAPTQHPTLRKRKAHNSNGAHRLGRKTKAQVRSKNSRALANHERHYGQPAPDDALSVLPAEIQLNILANVKHSKSLINLAITSKRYYAIAMPIIHNSIAVEVPYFARIAKAIRLFEPHLSITQKKQLKKMGHYKGRQKRFSNRLDQDAVPGCAKYVRQMTIGTIDLRESHKQVVMKTLEEVLQNLTNLEVLDTTELSVSMASSIVALKTLKALRIRGPSISTWSLSQLRGLKHLSISNMRFGPRPFSSEKSLQTIILNSSSTLESLEIDLTWWPLNFDNVRDDGVLAANTDSMNESPIFPALKSLILNTPSSLSPSKTCLSDILRSVNLLQLRKLDMMQLEGNLTFFKSLDNLPNKADEGTIRLRHLVLDMAADESNVLAYEEHMEDMYRFIASFDTLTSLEIYNHNTSDDISINNRCIWSRLQQVIIRHKGLESLRFRYRGRAPAYASVDTLRVLTENLPRLRVLEIHLQDKDLDGIAQSISRARNLESLISSTFKIRNHRVSIETFCHKMIESLLDVADYNDEFVWERVYCLKHMALEDHKFIVGSHLKRQLYMCYPRPIVKDDRSVWVQETNLLKVSKKWASQIMTSV